MGANDGYGLGWRAYSTCDLGHDHYFCPESHGYYYFRPYNYNPIASHQDYARRWNIDARNPYSNEIFQSIYREVELTGGEETIISDRAAPETVPPQKLDPKAKGAPMKSGQKKPATRTAQRDRYAEPLAIGSQIAREPVRR